MIYNLYDNEFHYCFILNLITTDLGEDYTMKKHSTLNMMNQKGLLSDQSYLFFKIAYHIAPMLLEDKPSGLISFKTNGRNLYALWQQYKNQFFEMSGIHFSTLRKTKDTLCVLFYHPERLKNILVSKDTQSFLQNFGYDKSMTLSESLSLLQKRFERECPHEMGVFLGYPIEDVKDFIKYKGKDCVLCGHWKVYHNASRALHTFRLYDEAKSRVLEYIATGLDPFHEVQTSFPPLPLTS